MAEKQLRLKDGSHNAIIRRKRRLADNFADVPYEAIAETIQTERPLKGKKNDGRHE